MNKKKIKLIRFVSLFLVWNILLETIAPTLAFALTAGPNAPEFNEFQPVVTTDMVDLFSGGFKYNLPVVQIPGPDGGGYALSLSYQAGSSQEEEASWVGYGWTLNPGSINRNTRGFPDDYNGANVINYNKVRPVWSVTNTDYATVNITSKKLDASFNNTYTFNNYLGFNKSSGISIGYKFASVGVDWNAEGVTVSGSLRPLYFLQQASNTAEETSNDSQKTTNTKPKSGAKVRAWLKSASKAWVDKLKQRMSQSSFSVFGSNYGMFNAAEGIHNLSLKKIVGAAYNKTYGFTASTGPNFGFGANTAISLGLQYNVPETNFSAYGYLFNPSSGMYGQNDADILSDYYLERGEAYAKRDLYLGIPFNNADNFSVAGEGLTGGFRAYSGTAGHYYPNFMLNKYPIRPMGLNLIAGVSVGIGASFGLGSSRSSVNNWKQDGNTENYQFNSQYPYFFRFNNDLGGKVEYGNTNNVTGKVRLTNPIFGFRQAEVKINEEDANGVYNIVNQNGPKSTSSYIDHTYNSSDGITSFSVYNEDGNMYSYGQPVNVRREANLMYEVGQDNLIDKYIAYGNAPMDADLKPIISADKHQSITGEYWDQKYAANYLLSSITTPDYVDLGAAGPDESDFGGWTKFGYGMAHGGSGNWYRFRTPYTGFINSKNSYSDKKDDLGSVMTGEKEVYYLKYIETKTHIAVFVTNISDKTGRFNDALFSDIPEKYLTGSGDPRLDGLGASRPINGIDPAGNTPGEKDLHQRLEKLEKIHIFSKSRPDKPIKTVCFKYNYSQVANLANNENGNYPGNLSSLESGKLTLEKVWFESDGVVPAKISPYEFKYQYKSLAEYPQELQDYYTGKDYLTYGAKYSAATENPYYDPCTLDPWGNLEWKGKERNLNENPWMSQEIRPENDKFDPAAWQLKQIILPSGGEIHVQYEQKDYTHVQDNGVMAMARLLNYDETRSNDSYLEEPWYIINVADLGVDPANHAEVSLLRDKIENYFGADGSKEKVYFKFLYSLDQSSASLDNCRSEYITGYVNFKTVTVEPDPNNTSLRQIKITLQGNRFGGGGNEEPSVPRQVCYEFSANQRRSKNIGANCEADLEVSYDTNVESVAADSDQDDIRKNFRSLKRDIIGEAFWNFPLRESRKPKKDEVGTSMDLNHSYIKLPMIKAKRGGGIRVKRLLMYDPGISGGATSAIYGSEYHYVTEAGESSGIATNEPSQAREENPLVKFLPREQQSWFSKITVGEDKKQTEGPLGETIMPVPSVGHSRVVVENIHSGKTGSGFAVHEFWTAKDYPVTRFYSDAGGKNMDVTGSGVGASNLEDNHKIDWLEFPLGLFNYSVRKKFMAQGYRFIFNNMHGQIKKVASYAGICNYTDILDPNESFLTSAVEYTYFEPGERIAMVSPDGSFSYDSPGKEMDVAMEMKSIREVSLDFTIDLDIYITFSPPFLMPTLPFPAFGYSNNIVATHSTSKIIRYPAIVKEIKSTRDGIENKQENLAFNLQTGLPVVTRTTDGHDKVFLPGAEQILDGSYYSVSIPAAWKYPEMGPKSTNAAYFNQLSAVTGNFVTYRHNPLQFNADNTTGSLVLDNLVKAEVLAFNKGVNIPEWFGGISDPGVKSKLDAVYRPYQSYTYKTAVTGANGEINGEDKIYSAGLFKSFNQFDWNLAMQGSEQTDKNWLTLNTVTRYSPNGNSVEEKNILGIHSAARFSHNDMLPAIIGENTKYGNIFFRSFEDEQGVNATTAHSGSNSFHITTNTITLFNEVDTSRQLDNKGGLVKFWLKHVSASGRDLPLPFLQIAGSVYRCTKTAQTGEWSLYSVEVPGSAFKNIVNPTFSVSLQITPVDGDEVFIDDARFQPLDAEATCYVYDNRSFRLLASYDSEHFGLYYQYDGEGKLVRKLIETERGLKTIQETQYNTVKKSK